MSCKESAIFSQILQIFLILDTIYTINLSSQKVISNKVLVIQINLFQKYSFLHQSTHNMTSDCSLNYEFSTRKIQVQNMLCTKIGLNVKTKNNFCAQHALNLYFSCNSINNLSSYCGLTDARMKASEKELPVLD